ncbi:MAG TPA: ribonuclease BN [Myxococcales bacterium]|nr:ribonuclease BN [Myxococcales bacterium]
MREPMAQSSSSEAWSRKLDNLYSAALARWSAALGGRAGRWILETGTVARAVVLGFRGEKIALRASALTYISILSLVPLLAVAFAIVRALGQESLRASVHDFIFTNLAPGTAEDVGRYLDEFIARASSSAMGGVGGVFLLFSAVTLLHNIESSLNEIWGVKRPRPLLQRVLIYWCVLSLGPLGLGFSLGAGATMRAMVERSVQVPPGLMMLVPLSVTVVVFTFLYVAAPNARVRFRTGLVSAIVAGGAWELAKWGYTLYAARSIRYSAIYGSLGAIPLFLLWVYLSWLILLFGARLAFALQHAATGTPVDPRLRDARARELLCAQVAVGAARDFLAGGEPPTAKKLARELKIDVAYVREAIRSLRDGGLLAETRGGGVVPARPPEQMSLLDVARAAEGTLFEGRLPLSSKRAPELGIVRAFVESDRHSMEALGRVDLAALARPVAEPQVVESAKAQ